MTRVSRKSPEFNKTSPKPLKTNVLQENGSALPQHFRAEFMPNRAHPSPIGAISRRYQFPNDSRSLSYTNPRELLCID